MDRVFHAFQLDEDDDITDIGVFTSLSDAEAGIAQYILWDMTHEHAFYFLSGDVELPWGYPTDSEKADLELDWARVTEWLTSHSPAELISWYRAKQSDLRVYVIERRFSALTAVLSQKQVDSIRDDEFRLENAYLRNGRNLLTDA